MKTFEECVEEQAQGLFGDIALAQIRIAYQTYLAQFDNDREFWMRIMHDFNNNEYFIKSFAELMIDENKKKRQEHYQMIKERLKSMQFLIDKCYEKSKHES